MPLKIKSVKKIILKFGSSIHDCGNISVQIILLTNKINYLQQHFLKYTKDHSGRRGLLRMVSQRRKLLDYFKKKDYTSYFNLIKKLNLRH